MTSSTFGSSSHSLTIAINGTTQTFAPDIPAGQQAILDAIQGPKVTH